jgi:S1-C subfamily serine protease
LSGSRPRRLRVSRLAVVLAAGGAVTAALLVAVLLLCHVGKDVVLAPAPANTQPAPSPPQTAQAPAAPPASPWDKWPAVPMQQPVQQQQPQPAAQQPVQQPEGKFSPSELYKHVSPSVVWVNNLDSSGNLAAIGSGFLVSRDGKVATNLHVIEGAHEATVRFHNGATVPVRRVVAIDPDCDLAVLAILEVESGYDYIQLSTRPAEVGARVYAIGNPEGLTNTLSEGIVSGLREMDGVQFIQTTAAISVGVYSVKLALHDFRRLAYMEAWMLSNSGRMFVRGGSRPIG